jgi:hypothetical protein
LFNLSSDIGEQNNLAKQYPEKLNEMLSILKNVRTESAEFPLETRALALKKRK